MVFYGSDEREGNVCAGKVQGDIIGNYIDVPEPGTNTWQAAGVGEWVEVTELLTPGELGFENIETFETTMANMVSVPITEVYTNLLTGANGFITQASMDISIYQSSLDKLWAGLIYGSYNPAQQPTVEDQSWNLRLTQGDDIVNLQGNKWASNEWLATVGEGSAVGGNTIIGEAGGTYGDGQFQGVGAGVVNPPETLTP